MQILTRKLNRSQKNSIVLLAVIFGTIISCKQSNDHRNNDLQYVSLPVFNYQALIGGDYLMDSQHSYVGFKIKYFGNSPVRGRFDKFDGTLFYDSSNVSSISASINIEVSSINTGNETRDNDLLKENSWFESEKHPLMTFRSTKIHHFENGGFELIGEISIKGVTKVDTIEFTKPTAITKDWAGNDQVDFSGKLTINRQDFGVFGGDFWSSVMENGLTQLSDDVEIELEIHCRKPDYLIRYKDSTSDDADRRILDKIKEHGIKVGLASLDSLAAANQLTAGTLSTIGYTLNDWGMPNEALSVFRKRLEYFPNSTTTWNQIGITYMHLGEFTSAKENFMKVLESNPNDSRALEYLRLIERIKF